MPRTPVTSPADLAPLAQLLTDLATRLVTHGTTIWDTTAAWAPGTRATTPSSTGPGDPDEDPSPPGDPTGRTATNGRTATTADTAHDRLRAHLTHLATHADDALTIATAAVPHTPRPRPNAPPDEAGDGWCTSCFRHQHHLEPVATRPDGRDRYTARCRWCGDFRATHGQDPPVHLLALRHAGRRITTTDVTRALTPRTRRRTRGHR